MRAYKKATKHRLTPLPSLPQGDAPPTKSSMGSHLDKPITEKENYESEAHGLKFGAAAMQGWRVEMEDAHTIIETIGKEN